jgi:hypothetical protein
MFALFILKVPQEMVNLSHIIDPQQSLMIDQSEGYYDNG